MKTFWSVAVAGIAMVEGISAARAEDLTPPEVKTPLTDLVVHVGASPKSINLQKTFGLKGVTQEVVRFTTTLGLIDVELFPATTPKTVANFLGYVDRGDGENGGYNHSLIQRSDVNPVPFVVQGGSYYINGHQLEQITAQAAIKSEAGALNSKGTIAMALSTGPDSATDAWYFNLADNTSTLNDSQNGGPFTVFGRAIESGLETINAIAALATYNLSDIFINTGMTFESVPLVQYDPSTGLVASDFVYTDKIALIPLLPVNAGGVSLLRVKVVHNTNAALVTVTVSGQKLKLTFHGDATGMTKITLEAVDAAGEKVKTSFTVKVQP